jgi:hypothetical protein
MFSVESPASRAAAFAPTLIIGERGRRTIASFAPLTLCTYSCNCEAASLTVHGAFRSQ